MKLYEYPPKLPNPHTAIVEIFATEDESDPDATLKISFEMLTGKESKSFETFKKILWAILDYLQVKDSEYINVGENS